MRDLSDSQKQAFQHYTESMKDVYSQVENRLQTTIGSSHLITGWIQQSLIINESDWENHKRSNQELASTVTRVEGGSYRAEATLADTSSTNRNELQQILFDSIDDNDRRAAQDLLTLPADASDLAVLKTFYSSAFNAQKQLYNQSTTLYGLGNSFYSAFLDSADQISSPQALEKITQGYILLSVLANLYNLQQQLADNFEEAAQKFLENSNSSVALENPAVLLTQLEDVNLPEYQEAKKHIIQLIWDRTELMHTLTPGAREYIQFRKGEHPQQTQIQQIIDADNAFINEGQLGILPVNDVTAERSAFEQFKAANDYVNKPEDRYFSYHTAPYTLTDSSQEQCKKTIEGENALRLGGRHYPFDILHKLQENVPTQALLELIDGVYKTLPEQFRRENANAELAIKAWITDQLVNIKDPLECMGLFPDFEICTLKLSEDNKNNSRFYFDERTSTLRFDLYRTGKFTIVADQNTINFDYNLRSSLNIKTQQATLDISLRCHAKEQNTQHLRHIDNLLASKKNPFVLISHSQDPFLHQISSGTVPVNTRLLAPALNVAHELKKQMDAYIKEPSRSRERLYRANLLLTLANTVIEQHQKGQLTDTDCKVFIAACRQIQAQHDQDCRSLFSRIFNRTNHFGEKLNSVLAKVSSFSTSTPQKFSASTSSALAKEFNEMCITTIQDDNNKYTNIVTGHTRKGEALVKGMTETFMTSLKLLKTEKEIINHWKSFKDSIVNAERCGMVSSKKAEELVATYEKKVVFELLIKQPKSQNFSKDLPRIQKIRENLETQGIFGAIKTLFKIGLSATDLLEEVDKLLNYHCAREIKDREKFNHTESRGAIVTLLETSGFKEFVLSENFNEPGLIAFLNQHNMAGDIKTTAERLMLLERLTDEKKRKIQEGDLETINVLGGVESTSFLKAFLDNTTSIKAKNDLISIKSYTLGFQLDNLQQKKKNLELSLSFRKEEIKRLENERDNLSSRGWEFSNWEQSIKEAELPKTIASINAEKTRIEQQLAEVAKKIMIIETEIQSFQQNSAYTQPTAAALGPQEVTQDTVSVESDNLEPLDSQEPATATEKNGAKFTPTPPGTPFRSSSPTSTGLFQVPGSATAHKKEAPPEIPTARAASPAPGSQSDS